MHHWGYEGMGGWGYPLMAVGMALFWALLVLGVVVLVRHMLRAGRAQVPSPQEAPERMLAARFAQGDIDAEEYRARLEVLRSAGHRE